MGVVDGVVGVVGGLVEGVIMGDSVVLGVEGVTGKVTCVPPQISVSGTMEAVC